MNQNAGYPYSVTLRHTNSNSTKYYGYYPKSPYDVEHYRTPGSKNGQRLYQYKDGSLTPLGRIHYGVGPARDSKVIEADNARRAEKRAERQSARDAIRSEKQAQKDAVAAEKQAKKDAAAAEKADIDRRIETAKKNKLMRAHPEWMSDEELKADTERARLETQREESLRNLNQAQAANTRFESNKTHDDYLSKNKKDMTNDELREATERIVAEKRYEDAVRDLKQARHPFAKQLFKDAANTMVRTLAQKGAEKLVNKIFEDHDEVSELKKRKEELELRKQVSDLEGDSGSDIVKRLTKGGFGEPDKEAAKDEKRISSVKNDIGKKEEKLDKLTEDRESKFEAFSKNKQKKLDKISEEREELSKDYSNKFNEYSNLIEKAAKKGDTKTAWDYIEKRTKLMTKNDKELRDIESRYNKLFGQSTDKSVSKADKQIKQLEKDIRKGNKLLDEIEKDAADRAKKRGIQGDSSKLFKGMSAADVETAKNLLIDMKQAMYLANEVAQGGNGREVDTGSFNFTNRFGGKGNNNGGNNNGGGDNQKQKKGNKK